MTASVSSCRELVPIEIYEADPVRTGYLSERLRDLEEELTAVQSREAELMGLNNAVARNVMTGMLETLSKLVDSAMAEANELAKELNARRQSEEEPIDVDLAIKRSFQYIASKTHQDRTADPEMRGLFDKARRARDSKDLETLQAIENMVRAESSAKSGPSRLLSSLLNRLTRRERELKAEIEECKSQIKMLENNIFAAYREGKIGDEELVAAIAQNLDGRYRMVRAEIRRMRAELAAPKPGEGSPVIYRVVYKH